MAALGLLGAHQVTYEKTGGEHAGMTLAGQSWLPGLPAILVTLSLAAFIAVLVSRGKRVRLPHPAVVLGIQVALFLALETVDRVLHGCCISPGLGPIAFGIAIQVPTAALVWLLTRFAVLPGVQAIVRAVRPGTAGSTGTPAESTPADTAPADTASALVGTGDSRGPPASR
jgi:hypothetical protein